MRWARCVCMPSMWPVNRIIIFCMSGCVCVCGRCVVCMMHVIVSQTMWKYQKYKWYGRERQKDSMLDVYMSVDCEWGAKDQRKSVYFWYSRWAFIDVSTHPPTHTPTQLHNFTPKSTYMELAEMLCALWFIIKTMHNWSSLVHRISFYLIVLLHRYIDMNVWWLANVNCIKVFPKWYPRISYHSMYIDLMMLMMINVWWKSEKWQII